MHFRGGLRLARANDLAALPAVEAAADELFAHAGIGPLPAGTSEVDELRASLVVIVAGDPVVGFARLDEVDGGAHLEQLSVHPSAARRGVGAALLEASVEWATRAGYDVVTLSTFADVPWNAPFYARHGFRAIVRLGPELGARREAERRIGLDDHGERVVMRRDA